MTPASLIDEIFGLGGSLILFVDATGDRIKYSLPREAKWLARELERDKYGVAAELRRRYLAKAEVSGWIQ